MGLRGFKGLRQALGVPGIKCMDRLLEIRMLDGMRQLSAILNLAQRGESPCYVDLAGQDCCLFSKPVCNVADPKALPQHSILLPVCM